jgi:hypothetical protein
MGFSELKTGFYLNQRGSFMGKIALNIYYKLLACKKLHLRNKWLEYSLCQRSVKMYQGWSNQNVPPLDSKTLYYSLMKPEVSKGGCYGLLFEGKHAGINKRSQRKRLE